MKKIKQQQEKSKRFDNGKEFNKYILVKRGSKCYKHETEK